MQLCRIIYYFLAALHVSSDIFAHHQEHLNCITASGITHVCRCSSFLRFLDHTQRRTTVGRTPLDEWSARRRDLYLTTHNTHIRQISMPPVGFEPTISAGQRPQTYALDRAATGSGIYIYIHKCNSGIAFLWHWIHVSPTQVALHLSRRYLFLSPHVIIETANVL